MIYPSSVSFRQDSQGEKKLVVWISQAVIGKTLHLNKRTGLPFSLNIYINVYANWHYGNLGKRIKNKHHSVILEVLMPGQGEELESKTAFLQEWDQRFPMKSGDYQTDHNCTDLYITIVPVRCNGISNLCFSRLYEPYLTSFSVLRLKESILLVLTN